MQIFRPDHEPDRPHGIMLLRNRLRPEDGKMPMRMRLWPVFSMGLILISGLIGTPTPAFHGEGLVTLLGGGTLAALIVLELVFDPQDDRTEFISISLIGYASIALMTVQPSGTAVIGTYAAVAAAVIRLPQRYALAVIIPIISIVEIGVLVASSERFLVFSWTAIAYVFMFVIGHLVRLSENHQIQAQALLDEEERTRLARNEAAALDERGRIARELHDVLAHSLSALSVELEGARLLALDREVDAEVIAAIGRAHRHASAGLDEARAAIKALRGDMVPGPDKLEELLEDMRASGIDCTLEISGKPRRLPSEAALAVFRTAQEALTNVRKHAEEAERVDIRLDYDPDGVQLIVADSAGDGAEPRVPQPATLSGAGAGYGVSGMRERAELIGGRLLAGPTEDGFRVELGAGVSAADGSGAAADAGRGTGTGTGTGTGEDRAPLRVIVADDQRVVREGLTLMLGLIDGIEPVGAAADGEEALAMVAAERPDVVLMDLRMPRLDGIEATRRLAETHPGIGVVALTTYADDETIVAALQAGARGYLTKDAGAEQIRGAVERVAAGEAAIDPAVQRQLIAAVQRGDTAPPPCPDGGELPDGLTPREAEVLELIAAGLSNSEIADRLVVSGATVKSHVNHLFAKIGARDRAQAVAYAYQHELVAPTDD